MFGLDRPFDAIVFSYVLSMIPAWAAALERALDRLRPGGILAIVDFGEQERLPRWFRRGLRAWLALFGVHPRAEIGPYLRKVARTRGGHLMVDSVFGGYARRLVYQSPARPARA